MGENWPKGSSRTVREGIFSSYIAPWGNKQCQHIGCHQKECDQQVKTGWLFPFTQHLQSCMWSIRLSVGPHHRTGADNLEKVQWRASRVVRDMEHMPWQEDEGTDPTLKLNLSWTRDLMTFGGLFQDKFYCDPMICRIRFKSEYRGPCRKYKDCLEKNICRWTHSITCL